MPSTRLVFVETMKEMGLFGTTIPAEYGGLGLGLDTYALILMELSRGWVTLPGIMNGSFIAATMRSPPAGYEQFPEHMQLPPRPFAWSYIQRSGRVDKDRLRAVSPRFVARYESRAAA